jgi:hypothetical protein
MNSTNDKLTQDADFERVLAVVEGARRQDRDPDAALLRTLIHLEESDDAEVARQLGRLVRDAYSD